MDGIFVEREVFEKIVRDDGMVYFVFNGGVYKVVIVGELGFYKFVLMILLMIEINGI